MTVTMFETQYDNSCDNLGMANAKAVRKCTKLMVPDAESISLIDLFPTTFFNQTWPTRQIIEDWNSSAIAAYDETDNKSGDAHTYSLQ
jgi:hypothetical protein